MISSTTGSGIITEVTKQLNVNDDTFTTRTMIIMRDVISPVNFIASEAINVNHEVLI